MKVLIKGAGDLASGIAAVLFRCGCNVVMTEIEKPLTVRREVSFSSAVYENEIVVEGIKGKLVKNYEEIIKTWQKNEVAIIVDEKAEIREQISADVMIDAVMAKKNIGTTIADAPLVIGLGPGFFAGRDCHYVIETMRGETLAKAISHGSAIPNTGVPGVVAGFSIERLLKSPKNGIFQPISNISDYVKKGQIVGYVDEIPVYSQLDGRVRGMLKEGLQVSTGMKIGDVDPRDDISLCFKISDKAYAIGESIWRVIVKWRKQHTAVVIMAAGESRRFGGNKLMEKLGDIPIYQYMLGILETVEAGEKIIVCRHREIMETAREKGMLVVNNEYPEKGVSYSIQLGIEECKKRDSHLQGILFCVCDQPGLLSETVDKLIQKGCENPESIVCASVDGECRNPVYWDPKYLDELMKLSKDQGGRVLFQKYQEKIIKVPVLEKEVFDIDTKEALESFLGDYSI